VLLLLARAVAVTGARRGVTAAKSRPLLPKRAAAEKERMDGKRIQRVHNMVVIVLIMRRQQTSHNINQSFFREGGFSFLILDPINR